MLAYAIFFAAVKAYLIFASRQGIKQPLARGKFGPLMTTEHAFWSLAKLIVNLSKSFES